MTETEPVWHTGVDAAGAQVLAALTRRPGLRREVRSWDGYGFAPSSLYALLRSVWRAYPNVPQKRADLHQLCVVYAQHPLQVPEDGHQHCTRFPAAIPAGTARCRLAEAVRNGSPPQILHRMVIAARFIDEPICPGRLWRDIRSLRYNQTMVPNATYTAADRLRRQWLDDLEEEKP